MLSCLRPNGTPKELERRRLRAMALLDKGLSGVEVAQAVGATPGAVSQWKARCQRAGPEALIAKPHPGLEPKLAAKQRQRLGRMLRQGARKHGYATELWTLKPMGETDPQALRRGLPTVRPVAVAAGHGLELSETPERRARERDDDAIVQRRARQWPRIVKATKTEA